MIALQDFADGSMILLHGRSLGLDVLVASTHGTHLASYKDIVTLELYFQ